jgi:murein DD-endopeptidase MepM/ murein hydrolase activator NlpD
VLIMLMAGLTARAQEEGRALSVSWEPPTVVPGAPLVFRVRPREPLRSLEGTWGGRSVHFELDRASGTWYGVAGVGLDASAGAHALSLRGVEAKGATVASRQMISVSRATYPTIALSVPRKYIEPDAATLVRIQREQALKKEVFGRQTPERLWAGAFRAPIDGVATDGFGTARTYNGVRQSQHQGLDYRAATGTPVRAMNGGRVALARELYFEGNCIVLDHGRGLLTIYMHLSSFKVKEGELVARGDVIGRSGATGRVTGPHLHASVRWQGLYLNPATMVRLALPEGSEKAAAAREE